MALIAWIPGERSPVANGDLSSPPRWFCEHLIGACSELVDLLLGRCPGLRIVATGREPLHVLMVTGLRPHTTYYYAIAARDNMTGRPGPRSHTISGRTG